MFFLFSCHTCLFLVVPSEVLDQDVLCQRLCESNIELLLIPLSNMLMKLFLHVAVVRTASEAGLLWARGAAVWHSSQGAAGRDQRCERNQRLDDSGDRREGSALSGQSSPPKSRNTYCEWRLLQRYVSLWLCWLDSLKMVLLTANKCQCYLPSFLSVYREVGDSV